MTDTVSIPRDVATDLADVLSDRRVLTDARRRELLAVLRPEVTLREKVAEALLHIPESWPHGDRYVAERHADAVLAVVADEVRDIPHPLGIDYIHDTASNSLRAGLIARLRGTS